MRKATDQRKNLKALVKRKVPSKKVPDKTNKIKLRAK
jgi:hypothetical protein